MIESLELLFERVLDETNIQATRFLFPDFQLNNRLTGLVGPRGVGKTTMLIQYIQTHYKDLSNVFYFSADHIYFSSTTLYEFVEELYLKKGIRTFFIDEVHKYPNWSQELKNLYDGFPKIVIVFSGSSSLELIKGKYDLSRRTKMYHLPGLSFREYLNLISEEKLSAITLEKLLASPSQFGRKIMNMDALLGHFDDYLRQGFYPFFQNDPLSYYEKILSVIEKTIYEDIAQFYNLQTRQLIYFNKILNFLASIKPGEVNAYNIAKNIKIDDKTVASYLQMLKETGLVEIVYSSEVGHRGLRKPEKIFLNNTNLQYALGSHLANNVERGTIRELFFIQSIKNAGIDVFHHKTTDYQCVDAYFEIGGKKKSRKQTYELDNAFLVKDDILTASSGIIPLLYFGFLY